MIDWIVGTVLIVAILWVMLRLDRRVQTSLDYAGNLPSIEGNIPVTIIKPVYGMDVYTAENFRSWAEQDYDGPVQLIFSFQRPDDPAIPLAKEWGQVIINPVLEGYSGKMSNLVHGLEKAQHEWIIFSDSDIRARLATLKQLATLYKKGAALISCLMRHRMADNIWGRIYAAFWNFEHMAFISPSIIEHGSEATGGTMALSKEILAQMGGLVAFKDYVAEDVAMGRKVHEIGKWVVQGPMVDSPVGTMSLRGLIAKFSRAALFSASMNDKSESFQYAALFSYLFVLLAGLIFGSGALLVTGAILTLLRVVFASRFWQRAEGEKRLFVEIILSDIVFLIAYIRALATRRLEWGGIQYRVTKGGRMVRVEDRKN